MNVRTAAAVAVAALGLTACTVESVDNKPKSDGSEWLDDTSDRAPTTTARPRPTPTTEAYTTDDLYVDLVRSNVDVSWLSDAELVDLGHTVCDVIDSYGGDTDAMMADMAWELTLDPDAFGGVDATGLGYVFGYSVGAYCPEYGGAL